MRAAALAKMKRAKPPTIAERRDIKRYGSLEAAKRAKEAERLKAEAEKKQAEIQADLAPTIEKLQKGEITSMSQIPESQRQYLNIPEEYFAQAKEYQKQKSEAANYNQAIALVQRKLEGKRISLYDVPDAVKKKYKEIMSDPKVSQAAYEARTGALRAQALGFKSLAEYTGVTAGFQKQFAKIPSLQQIEIKPEVTGIIAPSAVKTPVKIEIPNQKKTETYIPEMRMFSSYSGQPTQGTAIFRPPTPAEQAKIDTAAYKGSISGILEGAEKLETKLFGEKGKSTSIKFFPEIKQKEQTDFASKFVTPEGVRSFFNLGAEGTLQAAEKTSDFLISKGIVTDPLLTKPSGIPRESVKSVLADLYTFTTFAPFMKTGTAQKLESEYTEVQGRFVKKADVQKKLAKIDRILATGTEKEVVDFTRKALTAIKNSKMAQAEKILAAQKLQSKIIYYRGGGYFQPRVKQPQIKAPRTIQEVKQIEAFQAARQLPKMKRIATIESVTTAPDRFQLFGRATNQYSLQDTAQKTALAQLTGEETKTTQESGLTSLTKTATTTLLKPKTIQAPVSVVDFANKISATKGTITKTITPTPKPEPKQPEKNKIPKLFFSTEKPRIVKAQGYNAYVRREATKSRKASWVKINQTPLTKQSALSAMGREVDSTISARGKIEKVKDVMQKVQDAAGKIRYKRKPQVGVIDTKDKYFVENRYKFRAWKQKKGVKTKLPNSFIERQRYRQDLIGEKRQLQQSRGFGSVWGGRKRIKTRAVKKGKPFRL